MILVSESQLKNDGEKGAPIIKHGYKKNTGSWKVMMPRCDKKKCIGCRTCWLVCPDAAIKMGKDGKPEFDYSVCKGCLTCVANCPVKALYAENVKRDGK